jgi:hypothetical protein
MKQAKKKENITEYKIVVRNNKKTGKTFEDILNSQEMKKIVKRLLLKY